MTMKMMSMSQFICNAWSAVAEWLARWTLDPRVVHLNPGQSGSVAYVPEQNTLPLKMVGPFYLVYARGSKRPHSGYINVTSSGLTHSSIHDCGIGYAYAMGELCAPRMAVLHDTNIGAVVRT